jgi:hypothetical protein
MHIIRTVTCAVVIACVVAPTTAAAAPTTVDFRTVLSGFYSSLAHSDTAALRPQLDDDLNWVLGANGATVNKAQLLAAAGRPQVPAPRFEIGDVRARVIGEATIVEYLRTDRRAVGAEDFTTRSRVLDIWRTPRGRPLLARHIQTWLVGPATPVSADSLALQAYVGRYQIAPGYVDNVHWEAGHLVATASGQAVGAQLVPVSTNAFSPDGVGALMVFERDPAGRVLGYVQGYPDGRVIRAVRLP